MATITPKIGLKKPELTDTAGQTIADLQANFDKIDDLAAQPGSYTSGVPGFTPASVKAALDALAGVRIVEKGSNANGEYVRWENGWQVVWGRVDGTSRSSTGVYTDTITLAAAFFGTQFVAVANVGERPYGSNASLGNVRYDTLDIATLSSSQIEVRYERQIESGTFPVRITYVAFGRWK